MNKVTEIRTKKMAGCPGSWVWIAEATVEDGDKKVYVTVQYYDGEEYTVSGESMYDALTADDCGVVVDFLEEYDAWDYAADSKYADVFNALREAIDRME